MKVSCNGLLRCNNVQFGGIQNGCATTVLPGILNKRHALEMKEGNILVAYLDCFRNYAKAPEIVDYLKEISTLQCITPSR
jgi:hypothetical protein